MINQECEALWVCDVRQCIVGVVPQLLAGVRARVAVLRVSHLHVRMDCCCHADGVCSDIGSTCSIKEGAIQSCPGSLLCPILFVAVWKFARISKIILAAVIVWIARLTSAGVSCWLLQCKSNSILCQVIR